MAGIAYLMYHELERAGRKISNCEPGYVRYAVRELEFRSQLAILRAKGFNGLNVSEGLRADGRLKGVVLTFDDGCETDLVVAAPALADFGFQATFYVTSGFLGRPGFLSRLQLKELSSLGFEIGCHSRTHAYLTNLNRVGLQEEIACAKAEIEQILGRPIEHFSCPGGRWSQRVVQVVREAGFTSMATSRFGFNTATTNPYCLARYPLQRGISLQQFERLCSGRGFIALRGRAALLQAAKGLLGDLFYDRVRTRILGSS